MYTITVTIKNPVTSKTAQLYYQFDPNTLDQAKWSAAFPAVQAELNTLKTASAGEEPPVW
jgi:amino acid permease